MPRLGTQVEPKTPKVLENALGVVEAFGGETPVWSESALREHLSIPPRLSIGFCTVWSAAGYLIRSDDGRY